MTRSLGLFVLRLFLPCKEQSNICYALLAGTKIRCSVGMVMFFMTAIRNVVYVNACTVLCCWFCVLAEQNRTASSTFEIFVGPHALRMDRLHQGGESISPLVVGAAMRRLRKVLF